jgi:hypothetical protein
MPETRGHSLESIQDGFQALITNSSNPRTRFRKLFSGPILVRQDEATASGAEGEGVLMGPMRIELGSV